MPPIQRLLGTKTRRRGYGEPVLIDLNADLGEGFGVWRLGDDDGLLDVVTSANVACGFHAGDPRTMRRVCATALQRGVAIGAQVGYRDLAGFGRRRMDIGAEDLSADVLYQLGALDACARAAGTHVGYVKPHGALYNTAVDDLAQAEAVASAVAAFDRTLPLLALPGSALAEAAHGAGLPFVAEVFADRAYLPSGRLVPRGQKGAVIEDPYEVVARAATFALHQRVTANDGSTLSIDARSICVHGDTPGAVYLATEIRRTLVDAGVTLAPFAP
ncbi:MAG: 5-oxoprolinase (ATP-hydrolyzing) subunit [Pseudonocardiales bacterium]|nr:5-oxoprolinase (ATP-hydrolyzing) subunit [Pseudonocardiales bacterium]MDT4924175.1 5-oxoprolinase (ATP-hydrolyzing) subunit [Pseudonocardiales bacterium]